MSYDLQQIADLPTRNKFEGVTERFIHDQAGLVVKLFDMDGEFRTEAHSHPEVQVMVVFEGVLNMEVDGQDVKVGPGQVLTIEGGTTHAARSFGGHARGIDVIFEPVPAEQLV